VPKNPTLEGLITNATNQSNPINALTAFLEAEDRNEAARRTNDMRFVGYVLELGYDDAKIITCDPYKIAVGGIPRGSFLIMTPSPFPPSTSPHFTLLRVTGVSPTPLSNQVQQTYFELHKKSMPELDVWTQSELQWGALDCAVLGMFYADPDATEKLAFSGDVNNVVSAHRYKVFAPNRQLLDMIVNGIVPSQNRCSLGVLRTMECRLRSDTIEDDSEDNDVDVSVSVDDFKGCRTAMFGKTRLGKSNVVKLIAKALIDRSGNDQLVGQLIFDINGEYANDNPQNVSIRSAYPNQTAVYALTTRRATPSRPLRLNFYEQPETTIRVIGSLLENDRQTANYIRSFASVNLPAIASLADLSDGEKIRAIRKIQMYWAILHKAGFASDPRRLLALGLNSTVARGFDPGFSATVRQQVYSALNRQPPTITSLGDLVDELEAFAAARRTGVQFNSTGRSRGSSGGSTSGSGTLFDPDDLAMLDFIAPSSGSGPSVLRPYQSYHDHAAGDFVREILGALDSGQTVILDLGNATDALRRYFSDLLCRAVFSHQEEKFVNDALGQNYVQLYFEEAHNLFPPDTKDMTGVYTRFAKEGAKFHIGMVYSTQSPSTINKELLVQTENFFVGHLASVSETKTLSQLQVLFSGIEGDIMRARTPGYMRILTRSHRFVVPMQAQNFNDIVGRPTQSGA
jgi:hypothetical protein